MDAEGCMAFFGLWLIITFCLLLRKGASSVATWTCPKASKPRPKPLPGKPPPTREEMMADADREYREAVKAIAALSVPADVKEALRQRALETMAEKITGLM